MECTCCGGLAVFLIFRSSLRRRWISARLYRGHSKLYTGGIGGRRSNLSSEGVLPFFLLLLPSFRAFLLLSFSFLLQHETPFLHSHEWAFIVNSHPLIPARFHNQGLQILTNLKAFFLSSPNFFPQIWQPPCTTPKVMTAFMAPPNKGMTSLGGVRALVVVHTWGSTGLMVGAYAWFNNMVWTNIEYNSIELKIIKMTNSI